MKNMPSDERILSLYKTGLSMKAVAAALGCSAGFVCYRLKPYDVERHKPKHIYTEEECRRISERQRGRTFSEETLKHMREAAALRRLPGVGHKKERKDGYIGVYYPSHPDSNREGYVMEHRLVMEAHIGRRLKPGEVVHHVNHDRQDNRIENLRLMTASEHMSLHSRERHAKRRAELLTL